MTRIDWQPGRCLAWRQSGAGAGLRARVAAARTAGSSALCSLHSRQPGRRWPGSGGTASLRRTNSWCHTRPAPPSLLADGQTIASKNQTEHYILSLEIKIITLSLSSAKVVFGITGITALG